MDDQSGQRPHAADRVAMIGFGIEARARAVRLREQGCQVSVVVRPGGTSWIRAMADGFRPVTAREAVKTADVVVVDLPEAEQPAMWAYTMAPLVRPGTLVVFTHGAALFSGALELDRRLDVVLVAPGGPDACRIAVHQDATGRALDRATGFARALYGGGKVGTTSLSWEVHCELSVLIDRMGGMEALLAEWDRVLANPGHEPDEATIRYYEVLRAAVLAEHPPRFVKPPSSQVQLPRKRGAA